MNPIKKFYDIKDESVLEISTDKEEYISGGDGRIVRIFNNNTPSSLKLNIDRYTCKIKSFNDYVNEIHP